MENYKNMSDEQLLEAMRHLSDDELERDNCVDEIMERYKGLVLSNANRYFLIGADREDLVQEGMIGLFKAVRTYKPDRGPFAAFAALCVTREMYTAMAKYQSKRNSPLNSAVSLSADDDGEENGACHMFLRSESDPEQYVINQEFMKSLGEKMEQELSRMEKQVLRLFLDGNSYAAIGEQLGINTKSVGNALQRVKQKIGKFMN